MLGFLHLFAPRGVVDGERLFYFPFLFEAFKQRDGIFHRQFRPGADGEMRRRLGIADQHGTHFPLGEHPGPVDDVREVAPQRAVQDQRMAVELRGEDALEHRQHLGLALRVEAEVAPGRLVGLDHPGGAVGLVLVAVREDDASGVSRKKYLKASSGRVEPSQVNLLGRRSTLGWKWSLCFSRILELMPSATTIRSESANSSRSSTSRWKRICTPRSRARSCRMLSSATREQPQKPLPPERITCPL